MRLNLHKIILPSIVIDQAKKYIEEFMPSKKIKYYPSQFYVYSENPEDVFYNPNFIGLLGEFAVITFLGRNVTQYLNNRPKFKNDAGWDIIVNGKKYDVKTLKTKVIPRSYYRYNVSMIKENVDGYLFVAIIPPNCFYIVGKISKEHFIKKAIGRKKGEEASNNNFMFPKDTYDISILDLEDFQNGSDAL